MPSTLHGGPEGFDKRRWDIVKQDKNSVQFHLVSKNGDQGFPGELTISVSYQLTEDSQVVINYAATTNQATPVNLTNHAYFNLSGAESDTDCRSHILYVNADSYLPTDDLGIPIDEHFVSLNKIGINNNTLQIPISDLLTSSLAPNIFCFLFYFGLLPPIKIRSLLNNLQLQLNLLLFVSIS